MTDNINPFGDEPDAKVRPVVTRGRIIYDLPAADYFSRPGLSASALVHGVKSMKHMNYYLHNPPDPTPAMRWGSLCHSAILEPERFERDIAVFEGDSKRGKAWTEFCDENAGREIVTVSESAQLAAMIEAVHGRADIKALLTEGQREASMFWTDDEYGAAKGRMDVYLPGVQVVDLKTTNDLTRFKDTAARLLYHLRMGWYQVGVREITGASTCLPVYILTVEQDPPYDTRVYEYDSEALAVGRDVAQAVAKQYRLCEKSGEYPGVCADITPLKLPAWMMDGDDPFAMKAVRDLETMEADEL
jgi:exodeoxyribonuclease VIII